MSAEFLEPIFEAQPHELKAVAVMIFLAGRQPTVKITPEQIRAAEHLAIAIKNGNKAKALQLSSDFYKVLMSPEQVYSAYRHVLALNLHGNPDYQIVLDSLKDSYGQLDLKIDTGISLETALITLLLAITHSDKNSISYTRIDEVTGKARPTTFPLTEKLILNFIEPFQHNAGDLKHLVKRVLVFAKSNVVGNPAAEIAYQYQQRKKAYEAAKADYLKALAEQQANKPKSIEPPKIGIKAGNDVELLTQEFDKMLEFVKEEQAQQAVAFSFQSKQLRALLKVSQTPGSDFGAKLAAMYSQQLSPQKSQELSARLASRMKRLLGKMGNWKEEYWQEYQTALQKLGVWEGEDWLNKWRDHKSGKQVIAKTGKDYLVEEKPTTVNDLLDQADKIKDKLKGKHMLSTEVDLLDWMKREPSKAPPEQQKVLDALSRSDRLDELIDLALEPEFWGGLPGALQLKTYQVFAQFSHTDLDTIKAEMLKDIDPNSMEQAKQLLILLELQINKIAALFKKDFKLSYAQTLEILTKQKEDLLQREKLNSKEYLNSPAAQYSRYQQG